MYKTLKNTYAYILYATEVQILTFVKITKITVFCSKKLIKSLIFIAKF